MEDIAANKLGKASTLIVTPVDGGESFSITYSALSYARTAVFSEHNVANLCRALYLYYEAAVAYFNVE